MVKGTLRRVQRFERLERDIGQAAARKRVMRRAVVVAVLALPTGALLGYWWAISSAALTGSG